MRLGEEHMRTYLQNQRFFLSFDLLQVKQSLRFQPMGLGMDNALAVGAGVNCARSSKGVETKPTARNATIPDRPTKPIFIVLLRREFNPCGPGSLAVL